MLIGIALQRFFQLADELLLLGGQRNWRFDDHAAEEIASRPAANRPHTLVAKPENPARLRLRRHFDRDLTVERGHFDRPTERCCREADGNLAAEMSTVPLKDGVLAHVNFDVQIARWSAIAAGLAFAAKANAISGIHAGRHLHAQHRGLANAPLPEAGVARILDDGTG